ncbi:hypothetical protein ACIOHE_26240 [Streptomyces sp. NPDC087851]|uniref:hypothetical protein n=1 Tax=Streptomyces sp. NPDC087851 TaxID=3365810 RepID=UPI00381E82BA
MSTDTRPPGRLRGGLTHLRGRLEDRLHLSGFMRGRGPLLRRLGWTVVEGVIGFAVGLLLVTLWLRWR